MIYYGLKPQAGRKSLGRGLSFAHWNLNRQTAKYNKNPSLLVSWVATPAVPSRIPAFLRQMVQQKEQLESRITGVDACMKKQARRANGAGVFYLPHVLRLAKPAGLTLA